MSSNEIAEEPSQRILDEQSFDEYQDQEREKLNEHGLGFFTD